MREAFKSSKAVEIVLCLVGAIFFLVALTKMMLMVLDFSEYSVERLHGVFNLAGAGTAFVLSAFGVYLLKKYKGA